MNKFLAAIILTVGIFSNSYSQTTYGIDPLTACDSLTWTNGITYYADNNIAEDTLVNYMGGDSIVTLDLAVNYSSAGTDTINACDSLTWIDGITYYSTNNTAIHLIPNAVGCDSIISLNLTINNSTTSIDTIVACDSLNWIDGNTYFSANNTSTHTIPNAVGCDSIITLNLTVNISPTGLDSLSACDSLTWIDGNTYYSTNNSATYNISNPPGCDSIVILNLIITETPSVSIGSFATDTVCINDNAIFLPTGNPTGGTYSGNGIVGNTFDPSQAGVGFHTIYFSFGDSAVCLGVDSTQITVESCGVGINESSIISHINIYPNPTDDVINVNLGRGSAPINFTLFSIDGRVVSQLKNVTDKTLVIDISNNSKGIYFLNISNGIISKIYKVVKH